MRFEINSNARELAALLAGGAARLREAVARGLSEAGKDLEAAVKEVTPFKTGALRRSIRYDVSAADMALKIGSSYETGGAPLVYAAQVEFGGPIPKGGPGRLAWPVSPEFGGIIATKAGVGGMHTTEGREHTGATGSFVRPSKSGRTRILFFTGKDIGGPGKDYAPAFILASRVTQKGKGFLIPTVTRMSDKVLEQLERAIALVNVER